MFCLFVLYARTVGSSLSIYSTYTLRQVPPEDQSIVEICNGKPLQIGNRPAVTHKTHQPLALATLIFQYSVLSAHEQLMSCVRSLQLLQYIDY